MHPGATPAFSPTPSSKLSKAISDPDFTPSLRLTKWVTEPHVQSFMARLGSALLMYEVFFCTTSLRAVVIFSSSFFHYLVPFYFGWVSGHDSAG